MTIHVEYVAQMKVAAGTAEERLELDERASAQDAVRALADRHGAGLAELLLSDRHALRDSALVFVNNTQLNWDEVTPLRDGEKLTVLAPLAGG